MIKILDLIINLANNKIWLETYLPNNQIYRWSKYKYKKDKFDAQKLVNEFSIKENEEFKLGKVRFVNLKGMK